jgi:hypothetical protein
LLPESPWGSFDEVRDILSQQKYNQPPSLVGNMNALKQIVCILIILNKLKPSSFVYVVLLVSLPCLLNMSQKPHFINFSSFLPFSIVLHF